MTSAMLLAGLLFFAGGGSRADAGGAERDVRLADGRARHDAGEYAAAIAIYDAILAAHPDDITVSYERLLSTLMSKDLAGARVFGEQVLKKHEKGSPPELFTLMGTVYDDQGALEKGEAVFRRGLHRFPDDPGLRYNLAVNLARQEKPDQAARECMAALRRRPRHASSWYLLGLLERDLQYPGYAVVALARFLTLEPESGRAGEIAARVQELVGGGATVTAGAADGDGHRKIDVVLPANVEKGARGTQSAMLGLLAASRYLEVNEKKSAAEFFSTQLDTALSMISESVPREDAFWKSCAFAYFDAARTSGHLTALGYVLRRPLHEDETEAWIAAHAADVGKYREWSEAFAAPACRPD